MDSPRVRRRWRWRTGTGVLLGVTLVAARRRCFWLFSPPGAPVDTLLGSVISATRPELRR